MAVAALGACSRDGTTAPPVSGFAETWSKVSSRTWTIPSRTEAFRCTATLITTDEYFTGFQLVSPSAAQQETFLSVAASVPQTGDFNCNANSVLGTEMIYAAGAGTKPNKFGGGRGVHVAAGRYLLLESHIVNSSDTSITASTLIQGRDAKASDVTVPMDVIFVGTNVIQIASDGSPHTFTGGCNVADTVHIAAALALMHALGTHATLSLVPPGTSTRETLLDVNFDPTRELFVTLWNDAVMAPGSHIQMDCTYVNNTGIVVNFGESANSETCREAIYRYPPKPATSVSPFECIDGQTI